MKIVDTAVSSGIYRNTAKAQSLAGHPTHGDSGSPLVAVDSSGRFVQVGIFQAAVALCGGHNYAYYYDRLWTQQKLRDYVDAQQSVPTPTLPPVGPADPAANRPPVAAFSLTRTAGAGNVVTLDGSASSDPDGTIASWEWFSDSDKIGTGRTTSARLGAGISKTVMLRMTDNRGATGSATRTVGLPNRAPVITGLQPAAGAVTGNTRPTLSAAARDDDGDALQYSYRVTGPSVDVSSGWVPGTVCTSMIFSVSCSSTRARALRPPRT